MMDIPGANFTLKEEIRAYWSDRARTFDQSTGHRIDDAREAPRWRRLFREALGPVDGRPVLDLACGTGEISRMLLDLQANVTAVDFAEPMLERARAKLAGQSWKGMLSDVETLVTLTDASFDGAVARHLVWTLTNPAAAFAEWFRVLRPGATLLIIDGDWVRKGTRERLLRAIAGRLSTADGVHGAAIDMASHESIVSRVAYADGLSPNRLARDLALAGFVAPRRHALWPVYVLGMAHAPLADRLRLIAPARFALSVRRPV
jgi:ubiquinone/menaquinone biosynthesis C-methylase UbiE